MNTAERSMSRSRRQSNSFSSIRSLTQRCQRFGRRLDAAVRAAVNYRLIFADVQSRLGQTEHLPLLNARDHRRHQTDKAIATRLRLIPLASGLRSTCIISAGLEV